MHETVGLLDDIKRHEGKRVEVVDLGGNFGVQVRDVESVERTNPGTPGHAALPERITADTNRADRSEPGNYDLSHLSSGLSSELAFIGFSCAACIRGDRDKHYPQG